MAPATSTPPSPDPVPRLLLSGVGRTINGRALFRDVALTIGPGELVAIMGESGVGKSTLLNIVAGLDAADSGSITIEGVDLRGLNEAAATRLRRDRIGFVFQAFHILPYLTLRQNVGLPLALATTAGESVAARSDAMLALVGLAARGSDYAKDLSGGELQRIAIARALVHDPALILADEPTGNLDPETADRILRLFADAVHRRGASALIVTHSPVVAAFADRILHLTAAGLVAHGPR